MNGNRFRWLKVRQLDEKLSAARRAATPVPLGGWVKAVRNALGMSSGQLAARLGVRQSTVSRLEKSECEGTASLESLRKAADAMNCDVYYALVPRTSLEQTVRERAEAIAAEDVRRVSRTMALEDQLPGEAITREQREERRDALLRGSWRNLWK